MRTWPSSIAFSISQEEELYCQTDHRRVDGDQPGGKHQVVYVYLEGTMGTDQLWDHSINLEALGLAEHDLLALDVPFTEVWQTVKEFPSNKLPGPKKGRFYKRCWGVIKSDLIGGAWSVPKKVDAIAVKD